MDSIVPLTQTSLIAAVGELCQREPRFNVVVEQHGIPSLREAIGGLEGLLRIVTEQFLSLLAAKAIWLRLVVRLTPFDAETVLACSQAELLTLGLSRAKAKSFHGIALSVQQKSLILEDLPKLSDGDVFKRLIALPGVGPWTADIYLLSCLLRPDVWPWGDVALQSAAQNLFGLQSRPGKTEMLALGEGFRPHRTTAARLLWSHYRGLKNLTQA